MSPARPPALDHDRYLSADQLISNMNEMKTVGLFPPCFCTASVRCDQKGEETTSVQAHVRRRRPKATCLPLSALFLSFRDDRSQRQCEWNRAVLLAASETGPTA